MLKRVNVAINKEIDETNWDLGGIGGQPPISTWISPPLIGCNGPHRLSASMTWEKFC